MSASQMNTTKNTNTSTTQATNAFWNAMDREVGTIHSERRSGENGADEWSMYGLAGEKSSQLQGAFVAAFSGLVRGCTEERTREFLENIETEATRRGGKVHQNAMATLIVLAFQLRNCRGGKGEKDLSRWLFLQLYQRFPETVKALVPLFPKYGYWKDMSLFIQDCHGKRQYDELVTHLYGFMVEQLQDDLVAYEAHCENKRLAQSKGKIFDQKCKLSLLAKFIPKEGRSLDKRCKTAKRLAELMYPEEFRQDFKTAMRKYRQTVTLLNRTINTTEILMSEGRWAEVDFLLVASRCLNKHRRAFLNLKGGSKCKLQDARSKEAGRIKCRENLLAHMEKAKNGEVKFKGKQLYIHEIMNKMLQGTSIATLVEEEKTLLQLQWNTHRDALQERMKELGIDADQVVSICDVSGSMGGTPVEVAVAMSIMMSELAGETYGNRFLTFSEQPKWVEFQPDWSLWQKVHAAVTSQWGMTTDFLAAHDLILDIAIKHGLNPEQLPKAMFVFSDMQFNAAARSSGCNSYPNLSRYCDARLLASLRPTAAATDNYGWNSTPSHSEKSQNFQTHHQILVEAYRQAGLKACGQAYELPHMVYWNLRGDTVGFPVQADTPNTQMLSGFSADMIPLVLENRISDFKEKEPPTPWDLFVKTMDDDQYDDVHAVIAQTGEGLFQGYQVPVRPKEEEEDDEEEEGSPSSGESVELDDPDLVVVGHPATLHATPPQAPPSAKATPTKTPTSIDGSLFSSEQVSDWFQETFKGLDLQEVARMCISEGVDGKMMDKIVSESDRDSLAELGLTSRLRQTRVFTEWPRGD